MRVAAGTGAALLIAWWLGEKRNFAGGVIVVLAALLLVQATHSYRANTSPLYPIADTAAFDATVNDLRQTLKPNQVVVTAKDIGFYLPQRVIEGEDAFARGDGRLAAAIRRYPEIAAYVHDSFGPPVGPKTEAVLSHCFGEQRIYETATILYRNGPCG